MEKPFLYQGSEPVEWSLSQVAELANALSQLDHLEKVAKEADEHEIKVLLPAETVNFIKKFLHENKLYLKSGPVKGIVLSASCGWHSIDPTYPVVPPPPPHGPF